MRLHDMGPVPTGIFELRAYNLEGQLVDYRHGQNIVVNNGREALARLLGNSPAVGEIATWYVDTMKFGSEGHDEGDPTIMKEALVTDDDLWSESPNISVDVSSQDTDDPSYTTWPAARQVQFVATVDTDEGNGEGSQVYSEAGLYYDSGSTMFAHKAFGYILKNNTIKLVATWTFTF